MTTMDWIDWLLAAPTPTIRYLTLTDLLARPAEDAEVRRARRAIMTDGPVPAILAEQSPEGHWEPEQSYYTPKYVSTHWSMMLLAELHADPTDARIRRGATYMLDKAAASLARWQAEEETGFSCLWGNILRYALPAAADDPRLPMFVDYAIHDLQSGHCRCKINSGLACAWGLVRTLWGLAIIPATARSPQLQAAIAGAVEFLLADHSLAAANYPVPDGGKIHSLWFKLNFPLFYQTDILFTLRTLGEFDALDHPGAQPALDRLAGQRGKNGRWRGSSPYRSRTWSALGDAEEIQRWVTLQAAHILKQAGRLEV
ncbi:MAG: hypothetical protein KC547_12315 [Anaerolineae bacterium]|nr:hypothetical protein [Anaerolineae bacterium]